tara:strand:+ start:2121 stop:2870 length:750 start_codon:yes stop_codon:yes gene_type:complete
MLRGDPAAYSLKWYREIFGVYEDIRASRPEGGSEWLEAAWNSLIIGLPATLLATSLGTLAAIGLSRPSMPFRRLIMAFLISPMIVPIIITAAGIFLYYSKFNLAYTHAGLIIAHAALGTPFVVITVTATLIGFDQSYIRASSSLGARPLRTFWKVILPMTFPGIVTGALFAFVTSLDEVVVIIFLGGEDQVTLPRLMWSGIRQEITLTILAVATIMIMISIVLLYFVELLRRRNERLGLGSMSSNMRNG